MEKTYGKNTCGDFYITCPYCGKRVLMDWTCSECALEIEYDFDENFRRHNPHKPAIKEET